MEAALWLVGSLILFGVGIYYVVVPRLISGAPWYGTFMEPVNLYVMPVAGGLIGFGLLVGGLEKIGIAVPEEIVGVLGIPLVIAAFPAFAAFMGMPMPGFLMPKWVRERKRAECDARRRRRADKRTQRQMKRAARRSA